MSAKRIILIAEDYGGQHSNLTAELGRTGFDCKICKNTASELEVSILQNKPHLIILNSSRLGYKTVARLYNMLAVNGIQAEILNIYTYEDAEELTRLSELGVVLSCTIPYSPTFLSQQIERILNIIPANFKEFRRMIGAKVNEFLDEICPPSRQRGRLYLYEAVMMVVMEKHIRINFTTQIYTRIAHTYQTTVQSVEHSIRITIDNCWKNNHEKMILGMLKCSLLSDRKPSNIEFILAVSETILEENRRYFDVFHVEIRNNSFLSLYI